MSSSSGARRASGGRSRQLQFPVGHRWRNHVAVVDAGCGCRPRRATSRLLSQLPSFLRPSNSSSSKPAAPVRSSSRSSSGFFPSSASTASSAASAATFTTTHSSSYSAYSTAAAHAYSASSAYKDKHQVDPAPVSFSSRRPSMAATGTAAAPSSRRARHQAGGSTSRTSRKKRHEKMAQREAEDRVGVAVEKESSDPRADFRDSMVQMVLETGRCGWDDLRGMLRRLLALNAPRHHAAILAAFAEVCAQLTAPPQEPEPQMQAEAYAYHQYHAYDDYSYHHHY